MGKNRRHDEESSKLADKYDNKKELKKLEREQKEKERISKYVKPREIKKDGYTLSIQLHKLLTENKSRDSNWLNQFSMIRNGMKKLKIWDGFVAKYKLQHTGLTI